MDDLFDDFDLADEPAPTGQALVRAYPSQQLASLWPIGLLRDVALGIDDEDVILARYGLVPEQFQIIASHPRFKQELSLVAHTLQASGELFTQRARVLAEDYLGHIDSLVQSPGTDAKTKLTAICKMVEWAGLSNKKPEANSATSNQPPIAIQINL